jgi:hypothetical protein
MPEMVGMVLVEVEQRGTRVALILIPVADTERHNIFLKYKTVTT